MVAMAGAMLRWSARGNLRVRRVRIAAAQGGHRLPEVHRIVVGAVAARTVSVAARRVAVVVRLDAILRRAAVAGVENSMKTT